MKVETSLPQAPLTDVKLRLQGPPNGGAVQIVPTANDEDESVSIDLRPVHCALPESQRSTLLALASFAAAISPASTTTYYPAVIELARDLNLSITRINLSISVYQVSYHITYMLGCAHSALCQSDLPGPCSDSGCCFVR